MMEIPVPSRRMPPDSPYNGTVFGGPYCEPPSLKSHICPRNPNIVEIQSIKCICTNSQCFLGSLLVEFALVETNRGL